MRVKSGAGRRARSPANAAVDAIDRVANARPTLITITRTRAILPVRHHRIAPVDPVVAEVIGDVENLEPSEAQRLQGMVSSGDIRAVTPGTAAAINDDRGGFGQIAAPL